MYVPSIHFTIFCDHPSIFLHIQKGLFFFFCVLRNSIVWQNKTPYSYWQGHYKNLYVEVIMHHWGGSWGFLCHIATDQLSNVVVHLLQTVFFLKKYCDASIWAESLSFTSIFCLHPSNISYSTPHPTVQWNWLYLPIEIISENASSTVLVHTSSITLPNAPGPAPCVAPFYNRTAWIGSHSHYINEQFQNVLSR